jgi:hypothetical protein
LYFAEYGFAEAIPLPYRQRTDGSHLTVRFPEEADTPTQQQMQNAGWMVAVYLPLKRQREDCNSYDNYSRFEYWEVLLSLCFDDALGALEAGYADAVPIYDRDFLEHDCDEIKSHDTNELQQ